MRSNETVKDFNQKSLQINKNSLCREKSREIVGF